GRPTTGSTTSSRDTAFVLAFSPPEPAGSVIECSQTGPLGAFTVDACANRSGLADGSYDFAARGRDAAGNVGVPAEVTWTVDTSGPLVAFGVCTPSDGAVTDSGAVNYTWDFVDPADRAGGSLQFSLDGVNFAPSDGTFITNVATDGLFQFFARGVDAAGNRGPTIQRSFTLSTVGPAMTIGGTPTDGAFLLVANPSFTFDSVAGASF